MAMKTLDGKLLTRHRKDGFLRGPSQEEVLKCATLIAQGKPAEVLMFGTTRSARPLHEYPIRFTAVTIQDKDTFVIEGIFDYSTQGFPDGSRNIHGKRIRFNFNSWSRISTHVYSEE